MGVLTRFKFSDEFVRRFSAFIETGTGKGVSLAHAAKHRFETLVSIDIDERLLEPVGQRFAGDDRVFFLLGQSAAELRHLLETSEIRTKGILFWLDAHSPGGDYFGADYAAEPDRKIRLPLVEELETIRELLPDGNYAIIIDDLRIYEDGDWEHGNLPWRVHNVPPAERHTRFLDPFSATHEVIKDTHDAGYAILVPRLAPKPNIVEYGIRELIENAHGYVEADDPFSARMEYQKVLMATQPLAEPDVSAKRIGRGEACRYMAAMARAEHHEGSAVDWFLEASAADPTAIEYRIDLIYQSLIPRADLQLAREEANKAVKIAIGWLGPAEQARAWRTLAEVERQLGDAGKMRAAVDKAAALEPDAPETVWIQARLAVDTAQFEEAERLFLSIIDRPDCRMRTLIEYSICQSRMGDHQGALASVEDAIALGAQDDPMALWRRSDYLLIMGRYAEGWKAQNKRFELERKMPGVGPAGRRFTRPFFELGMKPQRVHVHGEQGFGDIICLSRYVPELRKLGHTVQLEVPEPLVDLFRHSFGEDGIRVIPMAADYPGAMGLEDFDSHIPMMSLPAAFETAIDTIPWNGPYLGAVPRGTPTGMIGICWKTGTQPGLWHGEYSRRKTVGDFSVFDPIARSCVGRHDLRLLDFDSIRKPGSPEGAVLSFADTAELLTALDIVITVDTALAHLAGAMGKRTMLMMHTGSSWHWMAPGYGWDTRSPWYPSVEIFRQERPHEWGPVVERIAAAL